MTTSYNHIHDIQVSIENIYSLPLIYFSTFGSTPYFKDRIAINKHTFFESIQFSLAHNYWNRLFFIKLALPLSLSIVVTKAIQVFNQWSKSSLVLHIIFLIQFHSEKMTHCRIDCILFYRICNALTVYLPKKVI